MPLLAAVIYLLLAMRMRIGLNVSLSGTRGSVILSAGAAGIWLRYDAEIHLDKNQPLIRARYRALRKKEKRKTGKSLYMIRRYLWLAKTGRMDRISFCARIGLEDAKETALAAGCLQAVASALLSAVNREGRQACFVFPDFDSSGYCAQLCCIFSCQAGDIMLAAIKAAVRKSRREGLGWKSIPLKV